MKYLFLFIFSALITLPVYSKDWSCSAKNPWGAGYGAQVVLRENSDGTYKISWSRVLLGPADEVVLNVKDLPLADSAKCAFKDEALIYCLQKNAGKVKVSEDREIDAFVNLVTTENHSKRIDANATLSEYSYVRVLVSTNKTGEKFDELRDKGGFEFAVSKSSEAPCGFGLPPKPSTPKFR